MESNPRASEYETRRHAFDLCGWINASLRHLESREDFAAVYFGRKGSFVKKLLEEALPLSRLALYLSSPSGEVYVTLHGGNQSYDATFEILAMDGPRTFQVEVTTTETEESTLRRLALARYGHVSLSGRIQRVGAEIVDELEFEKHLDAERRRTDLMFARFQKKVESGLYHSSTALLIYFSHPLPISLGGRAELVSRTRHYLREQEPGIGDVYYSYAFSNSVDHVAFYE